MRTTIVMQEIHYSGSVKQFRRSTPSTGIGAMMPARVLADSIDYTCPKCGGVVTSSEALHATEFAAECGSCGTICAVPERGS